MRERALLTFVHQTGEPSVPIDLYRDRFSTGAFSYPNVGLAGMVT
jgi:hypothetical protein